MPDNEPKRVLAVDDDRSVLQVMQVILQRAGYLYLACEDPHEALEVSLAWRPDLVLLDYLLPGMSGGEFLRLLRTAPSHAEIRDVPVIILTARQRQPDVQGLFDLGLSAYLIKPFGHRELVNVIDNALIAHAVHLRNVQLERQLRQDFITTIDTLASLLAWKDHGTGQHSGRVVAHAEALARWLGLEEGEVEDVKIAAALHDVGKIGVRDDVLLKSGPLGEHEREEMKKHVEMLQILGNIARLARPMRMVLHHHECWDGTGYPAGLAGDDIPRGAQIIAVADAYDAMVSNRPYREGLPPEEALQRLLWARGTQFAPDVVDCFVGRMQTKLER